MTQDNQIVPTSSSSSLPVVQAEPVRDGRYYQALGATQAEEDAGLPQLLNFIKRRLWVLLGVSLLSMTGLGAWILTRPPVYQGSFRLLVEPLSNEQEKLSRTLELAGADNTGGLDYKSQIEVLRSQKVLAPLAQSLQKNYPNINYYSLVGSLVISNPSQTKLLDVSYSSRDPKEVQEVLKRAADRLIQYSLVERNINLQQGVGFVDKQIAQQQIEVARLERQLEQLRRRNDIFRPDESASALSGQLTGLLERRRQLRADLASTETLYTKLRQQLGLNPREAVFLSTLNESPTYQSFLNRFRELESQIALASARFQDDAPQMQELLEQKQKILPLIEEEAQRIASLNNLSSSRNFGFQGSIGRDLSKQLVEAANRIQTIKSQEQALISAEAQLRRQTKDFAGIARNYDVVQRNLKISGDSLNRLLVARENLQLELTRQTMPWQLISTIDQNSISDASGRSRQFLIAGLASVLLALAVAWIMEKLDPSFHNVDDLSEELKLTCLGVIPFDPRKQRKRKQQLLPSANNSTSSLSVASEANTSREKNGYYSSSPFREAFYSLYTNISLMGSDNPIQILNVTSTSSGDGKTTIASNLAIAAAALGQRVLIVDVDLRYPRLHEAFDINNTKGLSNLLTIKTNKVINFSDFSTPYAEDENLQIMTAGPQVPDPPRLLNSNRLRTLLQEIRKEFDLVIFDTPPLGHFVDAKLLASISDGTIMVVSLDKTDRAKAKQVLQDLTNAVNTPVLGCVVNGVKQGNKASDYYYYYNRNKNEKQLSGASTKI